MSRKYRFNLVLYSLFFLYPFTALGQISVDKSIIHFGVTDRPFQNVVVTNSGNQVISVLAEPREVLRSGFKDEKRIESRSFLVSPKRFSVEANGQRTIRLLLTNPPDDQQRVFRVRLFPQSKNPEQQIVKEKGGRKAIVKVLTGTGVLVFKEPVKSQSKLTWEKKGDRVVFKNEGNVYSLLFDGQLCDAPDQNCREIPANRLYVGNTWGLRIPKGKEVRFKHESAGATEEIVIK